MAPAFHALLDTVRVLLRKGGQLQQLSEPEHRVQGRSQLVAHPGQEVALGLIGALRVILGAKQVDVRRLQLPRAFGDSGFQLRIECVDLFFAALSFRDVEPHALGEGPPALIVADHHGFLADPDLPAVAMNQPVLDGERLTRDVAPVHENSHVPVVRVQQPGPEFRIGHPLFRCIAQKLLDLGTDVDRARRLVQRRDVRDGGHLLDQRAIPRLDGLQGALGFVAFRDVVERHHHGVGLRGARLQQGLRAEREPPALAIRPLEPLHRAGGLPGSKCDRARQLVRRKGRPVVAKDPPVLGFAGADDPVRRQAEDLRGGRVARHDGAILSANQYPLVEGFDDRAVPGLTRLERPGRGHAWEQPIGHLPDRLRNGDLHFRHLGGQERFQASPHSLVARDEQNPFRIRRVLLWSFVRQAGPHVRIGRPGGRTSP